MDRDYRLAWHHNWRRKNNAINNYLQGRGSSNGEVVTSVGSKFGDYYSHPQPDLCIGRTIEEKRGRDPRHICQIDRQTVPADPCGNELVQV